MKNGIKILDFRCRPPLQAYKTLAKKLYPIYETSIELDVFLMHQSGIYAGPDFDANHWTPVDRLYISPDMYNFFPGGELYINSITKLQDQFIFASAYPIAGLKESVDESLKFPLSKDVMQKYMYVNAARPLSIQARIAKWRL